MSWGYCVRAWTPDVAYFGLSTRRMQVTSRFGCDYCGVTMVRWPDDRHVMMVQRRMENALVHWILYR